MVIYVALWGGPFRQLIIRLIGQVYGIIMDSLELAIIICIRLFRRPQDGEFDCPGSCNVEVNHPVALPPADDLAHPECGELARIQSIGRYVLRSPVGVGSG